MKSVKKNYVLNMIYQVFLLIVPIAVTPYISRVLTEVGTGQYSYTFSITTYFTLFAALGFGYYGQRLIAGSQGNKKKQTIDFYNVVLARLVPVFIACIVFITLIAFNVYGNDYNYLMMIMLINVIAVIFDITFFFQGNEEFLKIVIRNVFIKSLSIACIFIFIKKQDDLWLYVLIQALTVLLSNISLWFYMPKYLCRIKIRELNPLKHLWPTFILFIPTIAISVYTTLDKTLIGALVKGTTEFVNKDGTVLIKKLSDIENGNYEYSEKLIKMIMTIVTSLGTVMIPRNSYKFANNDVEGVKENIYSSCRFVFLLAIPMTLGCICVASNLMPWYLGAGYEKAPTLMMLLAPLILIIGLSNVFGLQLLIPSKNDKLFIIAVTSGALVNLILNLIFIPMYFSYGAAISTVIGELVVTTLCIIFSKKYINFWIVIRNSWKYFISGFVMFIPCYILQKHLDSSIFNTFIIIISGVFIYFLILLILRDSFYLDFIKKIYRKLKGKIKKSKDVEKCDDDIDNKKVNDVDEEISDNL